MYESRDYSIRVVHGCVPEYVKDDLLGRVVPPSVYSLPAPPRGTVTRARRTSRRGQEEDALVQGRLVGRPQVGRLVVDALEQVDARPRHRRRH